MNIRPEHLIGFAVGVVASAGGYYVYKKNQSRVDSWLRDQGISVPQSSSVDPESMSLEELVIEKEKLEDLIATREMEGAAISGE